MNEYYLVNSNPKLDLFSFPGYYNYEVDSLYGYKFSKAVTNATLKPNVIIGDLMPICALIIHDDKDIIFYRGSEKIIPKNKNEIFRYILNQCNYVECQGDLNYILSDTILNLYDFLNIVKKLRMTSNDANT